MIKPDWIKVRQSIKGEDYVDIDGFSAKELIDVVNWAKANYNFVYVEAWEGMGAGFASLMCVQRKT